MAHPRKVKCVLYENQRKYAIWGYWAAPRIPGVDPYWFTPYNRSDLTSGWWKMPSDRQYPAPEGCDWDPDSSWEVELKGHVDVEGWQYEAFGPWRLRWPTTLGQQIDRAWSCSRRRRWVRNAIYTDTNALKAMADNEGVNISHFPEGVAPWLQPAFELICAAYDCDPHQEKSGKKFVTTLQRQLGASDPDICSIDGRVWCLSARVRDARIYAFPGTTSSEPETVLTDWATNLDQELAEPGGLDFGLKARFHQGFLKNFAQTFCQDEIGKRVLKRIQDDLNDNRLVIITGHSAGAVYAVMSALMLMKPPASSKDWMCITFGAPMVGDSGIAAGLASREQQDHFWHIICGTDIVPRILLKPAALASSLVSLLQQVPDKDAVSEGSADSSPESASSISTERAAKGALNSAVAVHMKLIQAFAKRDPTLAKKLPFDPARISRADAVKALLRWTQLWAAKLEVARGGRAYHPYGQYVFATDSCNEWLGNLIKVKQYLSDSQLFTTMDAFAEGALSHGRTFTRQMVIDKPAEINNSVKMERAMATRVGDTMLYLGSKYQPLQEVIRRVQEDTSQSLGRGVERAMANLASDMKRAAVQHDPAHPVLLAAAIAWEKSKEIVGSPSSPYEYS